MYQIVSSHHRFPNFQSERYHNGSPSGERESKIVLEVDHIIDATCELNFEKYLCMSADDNSTLCYVVGAISRSLLKKLPKNQKGCCSALSTRGNTMSIDIDGTESSLQDEEFLRVCITHQIACSLLVLTR